MIQLFKDTLKWHWHFRFSGIILLIIWMSLVAINFLLLPILGAYTVIILLFYFMSMTDRYIIEIQQVLTDNNEHLLDELAKNALKKEK